MWPYCSKLIENGCLYRDMSFSVLMITNADTISENSIVFNTEIAAFQIVESLASLKIFNWEIHEAQGGEIVLPYAILHSGVN